MVPAGRPWGACRTSKRKMSRRVACANAASESMASDVFIFPKQWKYKVLGRSKSNCHDAGGAYARGTRHTGACPEIERRLTQSLGDEAPICGTLVFGFSFY